MISDEEFDFLQCILAIPFAERSWKKVVTLDSLHAFYGGPIPMDKARRLDAQSHWCECSSFFFLLSMVLPLLPDSLVLNC